MRTEVPCLGGRQILSHRVDSQREHKRNGGVIGLLISEIFMNATEDYCIAETDIYETFVDTPGQLFRAAQREHGRCISKVYADDRATPVGYVFNKKAHYTNTGEPYLQETWITIHDAREEER